MAISITIFKVMKTFQHKKHWMKHTAMVPKGFIRYHVLESLSEKPMSGSEIMDEIENRTNGRWRPSPGSIYPLLAWLQDNGHVKELPSDQSGMKRYELRDKGKALLEEQRRVKKDFEKEARFIAPPFLSALWFHIPSEKTAEVRDSVRRVIGAFFDLGNCLEKKFSEQAITEATKALDETALKLEEICKRMKEKKYE